MEPLPAPAAPQTMDPVQAARQLPRRQRYLDLMNRVERLRELINAVSDDRPASSPAPIIPDQSARSDSIRRLLSTRTYAADGAEEEAAGFSGGFCVVCHSEFAGGESIGTLECRHEYHSGCIHTWLLRKNYCPVCRRTAFAELE